MLGKFKSNILYTVANIYALVLPFVFGILFRNYVPEEVIGVFIFANSFVLLFDFPRKILSSFIERMLPKYIAQRSESFVKGYGDTIFSFLFASNIILSIFILVVSHFLYIDDEIQRKALYIVTIKFFFEAVMNFYTLYFKNYLLLKKSAVILFMKITVENIVILAFVFLLQGSDESYFVAMLSGSTAAMVVVYLYAYRDKIFVPVKVSFSKMKWVLLKESWKVGISLSVAGFLLSLLFAIDKYYLKYLTGHSSDISNATLAFYGFAAQGVLVSATMLNSFVGSFGPKIYKNADQKKDNHELIFKISVINVLGSFFIASALYLLIDYVVPVIFKNRLSYLATIPYFKVLSFSIIPLSQYYLAQFINVAHNKYFSLNIILASAIVVSIALNITMYEWLGDIGICWAMVISLFLTYLAASLNVRQSFKSWYFAGIASVVFALFALYFPYGLIGVALLSSLSFLVLIRKKDKQQV